MRALLLLVATSQLAYADSPVDSSPAGLLRFVDETLTLPPSSRERPRVRVRIEPAPAHPRKIEKKK